ncbi:hypothetical protein ACP70R_034450 [Stipagrostis hirtigluma subsp. patula]
MEKSIDLISCSFPSPTARVRLVPEPPPLLVDLAQNGNRASPIQREAAYIDPIQREAAAAFMEEAAAAGVAAAFMEEAAAGGAAAPAASARDADRGSCGSDGHHCSSTRWGG